MNNKYNNKHIYNNPYINNDPFNKKDVYINNDINENNINRNCGIPDKSKYVTKEYLNSILINILNGNLEYIIINKNILGGSIDSIINQINDLHFSCEEFKKLNSNTYSIINITINNDINNNIIFVKSNSSNNILYFNCAYIYTNDLEVYSNNMNISLQKTVNDEVFIKCYLLEKDNSSGIEVSNKEPIDKEKIWFEIK